jgi:hypothetical protein
MTEIEQLINETLGGKRLHVATRDIATNAAGGELIDKSEQYLPELEAFIRQSARPESSNRPDQFGMEYVLGAFVVGSVRNNRQDSFEFMRSLPVDWLDAVIGSASTFFWTTRRGYSCGVAPNDALVTFVNWATGHENEAIVSLAKEVARQFQLAASQQREQ